MAGGTSKPSFAQAPCRSSASTVHLVQCLTGHNVANGVVEERHASTSRQKRFAVYCVLPLKVLSLLYTYGRHTFPVSEELLLQLYDHTMEVRLWNSREKLAPRARFDRPRAFRLPIPPPASKEEDEKETSQSGRPDKFPLVRQQAGQTASTRGKRRARTRKKASNVSSISEEDTDPDLSTSISECRSS